MAAMEKPISFTHFGTVFYAGLLVVATISIPASVANWVAQRRQAAAPRPPGGRRGLHEADEGLIDRAISRMTGVRVRVRKIASAIVLGAAGNFLYNVLDHYL